MKFGPYGLIYNTLALVQVIAWRRIGNKPLSEAMLTHMCGTSGGGGGGVILHASKLPVSHTCDHTKMRISISMSWSKRFILNIHHSSGQQKAFIWQLSTSTYNTMITTSNDIILDICQVSFSAYLTCKAYCGTWIDRTLICFTSRTGNYDSRPGPHRLLWVVECPVLGSLAAPENP